MERTNEGLLAPTALYTTQNQLTTLLLADSLWIGTLLRYTSHERPDPDLSHGLGHTTNQRADKHSRYDQGAHTMSKNILAALTLAFLATFATTPAFADDNDNADVGEVFVPGPHHGGAPSDTTVPEGTEPPPAGGSNTDTPVVVEKKEEKAETKARHRRHHSHDESDEAE